LWNAFDWKIKLQNVTPLYVMYLFPIKVQILLLSSMIKTNFESALIDTNYQVYLRAEILSTLAELIYSSCEITKYQTFL